MCIGTQSRHITHIGGNVFADFGFEPVEAAVLKAESQQIISEKLAMKDCLMTELVGWIETKNHKLAEAAEIFGVTHPRVSDVINNKGIKFTIDALVDMLAGTGKHVQVSVRRLSIPRYVPAAGAFNETAKKR